MFIKVRISIPVGLSTDLGDFVEDKRPPNLVILYLEVFVDEDLVRRHGRLVPVDILSVEKDAK